METKNIWLHNKSDYMENEIYARNKSQLQIRNKERNLASVKQIKTELKFSPLNKIATTR
jgi:hypothetical protein